MTLNERETQVLKLRIEQRKTLEECAKEMGVTRERVRQLEAKVRRKISTYERKEEVMEIELDRIIEEVDSKIFVMETGKEYAECPECVQKDIDLLKEVKVCLLTLKQLLKKGQK